MAVNRLAAYYAVPAPLFCAGTGGSRSLVASYLKPEIPMGHIRWKGLRFFSVSPRSGREGRATAEGQRQRQVNAGMFDAVVLGSGPAGIATVGKILDHQKSAQVLWIDPLFRGGRVGEKYGDVSSNTKVSLFLAYANALESFREIIRSTPTPNAITALQQLNQDAGCRLHYASDMLLMLTEGLRRHPNVDTFFGKATSAAFHSQSSVWTVQGEPTDSNPGQHTFQSRALVLCTGSAPSSDNPSIPAGVAPKLNHVDLDVALDRNALGEALPSDQDVSVGVVGSSHSAIVVIMNLYELATTSHPRIQMKWFTRRPLVYAEYMDGWILRDNTGLKGASADFARAHLEDEALKQSPVKRYLEKIDCSHDEVAVYREQLPKCTHLVQAIGYHRNPVPKLSVDNRPVEKLDYNPETGDIRDERGQPVPNLHGAGIAFPEKVVDPYGNTEYAVGMWKFMKYLDRVVPEWGIGNGDKGEK
ncbi:hypothetical protein HRR83_001631 [Exophiala dermatitidis]|uniref:L-ornithine N(5)-monooxygenase n=2 Tax=Exophiala dermatitidis TaxID=5970 RepID=H6C5V4_EXODN|nr:uncharacterized protein HMPREF1120_07099 [Exophiala dermatitidis NIH/UT8656]KAJ4516302.1 hypothetical protein HRR73_004765 [Exophiala dermatitidis]EHY59100.1 hypothetical protein HMPREF1120_07099 [Exophiala dermatitidis NIH/UT8656]KAJ4526437.1 hypothetical protein HRR74_001635 [Exophiala dermatitidis]KAJ4532319.1 hypothetical protein HRR76_007316 [Exophiala dermatitidis]KAJ4546357.1 hypothetical protein HRR77_004890 [Exophiala dermatitidis]